MPKEQMPRPLQVLNRIDYFDSAVEVIGDPDNAFYEYRYFVAGKMEKRSEEQYGSIAAAMRDGLNHILQ